MEVVILDREAAGELVADHILRRRRESESFVLGVATGSTPGIVYEALARRAQAGNGGLDFAATPLVALDEYVGLAPDDPRSYRATIEREVADPLGVPRDLVLVPDGDPERLPSAGERFETARDALGGVDVQLLGIGSDGHIGFNEPGSSLASRTRVKTLSARTRRDNARFFDDPEDVPTHCVTQGVATILSARHLVLLAFGTGKADAVAAAVEGPVSASCPASAIQLHPHVTVVVDRAAAARLERADYYEETFARKPAWQSL